MTPHRPWVAADLHFSASKYVLLKCGCHHNNCCKAMQCGSVIKQLPRGEGKPLARPASPAHAADCTTYSPWVVYFLDIVQHYLPGVHVIRDWRDVPGLHHFHFDAALISPHVTCGMCSMRRGGVKLMAHATSMWLKGTHVIKTC